MSKITTQALAVECALRDLADAAKSINSFAPTDGRPAIKRICTAVAYLISGTGTFGGSEQTAMMERATAAGFAPEFYAGSIRVTWTPKA